MLNPFERKPGPLGNKATIANFAKNLLPMQLKFTSLSCSLLFAAFALHAQPKADRKIIRQLQDDIGYLASDSLEGRRTGSEGERKAGSYIVARYEKLKIAPYGGDYRHTFPFVYGKEMGENTIIRVGQYTMKLGVDAFPFPFSGNKKVISDVLPDVQEQGNTWLMPMYASEDEAKDPHFDAEKQAYDKASQAAKEGATAVVFYDNYDAKFPPEFNRRSEYEALSIPVVFVLYNPWREQTTSYKGIIPIELNINLRKPQRTGTNIAAYINNGAKYTVVIGAHYDHLGYGEDGNSLYAGKDRQIHNGADDNASGTAALLTIAEWMKHNKLRHYNYLFVHFSGEELGLYGSKAFTKETGIDSAHIAYMMNMDMVGRLNDSTHALTLGGVGTSPAWSNVVTMGSPAFKWC